MKDTLNGKIALVTGGGRGIGAAIALRLAGLGATTVVCGRTLARLQHTAGQIRSAGGESEALACDVADWNSVAALADRVQKTFGRLDVLVNNAGVRTYAGLLHTMPTDKWDPMLNTNLRGVFYMVRAFAPLMISAKTPCRTGLLTRLQNGG
jgi:NAD(P)-dependent dehydrogenase (short-subunit alcohol dehydrogenase family)